MMPKRAGYYKINYKAIVSYEDIPNLIILRYLVSFTAYDEFHIKVTFLLSAFHYR